MLCPYCHGTRWVVRDGARQPCPECGGMGEVHCCDGLQEQLDPGLNTPAPAAVPPAPAAAPGRGPAGA